MIEKRQNVLSRVCLNAIVAVLASAVHDGENRNIINSKLTGETCHLDGQVPRMPVAARRISRLQRLAVMEIRPLVRPVRIVAIPAFSNSTYNLKLDVGTMSVD